MPFFHMLPDELAIRYVDRSRRRSLVRSIAAAAEVSPEAAVMRRIPEGTGVSYHEFEVAFGAAVHEHVVLSGYEPEILACMGVTAEEAIRHHDFAAADVRVHPAFARDHLDFVVRKP
jgi:hypothetical protein